MPMPPPIRPNGNPARILEKRISKKSRRRIELVTNEWPNLHRRLGSSPKMLTPRQQGDFGERSAAYWLASRGATLALPFGTNRHWDLIAELEGRVLRVQVKTAVCRYKDRWAVTVCTRGGNQSWSGLVKTLDVERFDFLFVVVGDGRRWFIPADRVGGRSAIHLGGRKYAEFEVDRGDPIPGCTAQGDPSTIAS
jgi:PD-(D/E)XK endonuclease